MTGPIDFIVVGFAGKKFDGSILATLTDPIEKGVIRLISIAAVRKDEKGAVQTLDIGEVGGDYLVKLTETAPKSAAVDQDDIDEVADLLENDTSAALLVIEHLWAKPLKQSLIDAKGVLIAEGRIHPEAAAELSN